jgi:hypothetical protein
MGVLWDGKWQEFTDIAGKHAAPLAEKMTAL